MADWEDIVLGGAIGTIGGFFLSKRTGPTPVPEMIQDAALRHKIRVEQKIASSQQDPTVVNTATEGKGETAD